MSTAMDTAISGMEALAFTRDHRVRIVKALLAPEVDIAKEDPKVLKVALTAMADMDRQELGLRKIDASEKGAAADRLVGEALTQLLSKGLVGVNPFEANGGGQVPAERTEILPDISTTELSLNPGETDIGTSTDNLMKFAGRTGIRTDSIAGADTGDQVSEYAPKEKSNAE